MSLWSLGWKATLALRFRGLVLLLLLLVDFAERIFRAEVVDEEEEEEQLVVRLCFPYLSVSETGCWPPNNAGLCFAFPVLELETWDAFREDKLFPAEFNTEGRFSVALSEDGLADSGILLAFLSISVIAFLISVMSSFSFPEGFVDAILGGWTAVNRVRWCRCGRRRGTLSILWSALLTWMLQSLRT